MLALFIKCITSIRAAPGKLHPMEAMPFMKRLPIVIIIFGLMALSTGLRAQLVYQENFNYSGPLSSNGWIPFSNTGNSPINSGATGLTYAGYANSGIGPSMVIYPGVNFEADEHVAAADITGGSLYVGFLINVQSSTGNGKVVLNLNTNGTGNFPNSGLTLDATHFGVVTNGTTTYAATTYVNSTTYLVVVELSNVTGKYSIYINPTIGGAKPAAAASTALITGTKPTLVNAVRIFQNGTTNSFIDGIRVGKSWSDIVGGGPGMILHEDFNSGSLTGSGWNSYNGCCLSTASPLNLTGYGSGTGKSVVINSNAAYFKSFPPVTTGVVYAGFLVKVQNFNSSAVAGNFNFYSSAAGNAFNYQQGFVTDDIVILILHNYKFGVKYNGSSVSDGPSVSANSTYLLVLGYDLSTNKYSLWVSPNVGGASPPGADVVVSAGTTVSSLDGISIAGVNNDDLNIGEIHVSTNWHDVVSYAPPPQPTNLATTAGTNNVQLNFNAAASGNPSGYLTLRSTSGPPDTNPVKGVSLYTAGQTIGNATVISSGNSTTVNDNSVSPGTTYYYNVYSYGTDGSNYVYQTVAPLQGIVSTAVCCPPSGISFSSLTNTSVTVNIAPPGTPPTGYLLLSGLGVPAQGAVYNPGDHIGTATVIGYTTSAPIVNNGLPPASNNTYYVYSYGGSNFYSYNLSAVTRSVYTLTDPPASQPTALTFSSITHTTTNVSFSAAAGSPNYLVLRKAGSAPTFPTDNPVNATTYTTGDIIGSSTVAYSGAGTTFSQSTLTPSTNYFYAVFSYTSTVNGTENYLTTLPLTGNAFTLATPPTNQPTALSFPTFDNTSMTISFSAATGSPGGYLVIRKTGSAPSFPSDYPISATPYTAGNIIGSSTVAYSGSSTSFSDTGLSPGTTYYYAVFSYNGSSLTLNYYTTAPLQGSKSTIANPPSAQPTGLSFSGITHTSIAVAYTAASGSPAGYLVIRKAGSAPVFPADNPLPGIAYTAGNAIGGSTVAYSGGAISFGDAGLTPATTYYYAVFSYTGSGVTLNYLAISPLTGNQLTLSTPPIAQPTALTFPSVTHTTTNVSFTAAAGSPNYLVLRKAGSTPTFPGDNPVNATTYSAGDIIGSSTVAYSGAATAFSQSSLTPGIDYFYAVFSYTSIVTGTENYLTTLPLMGNAFTLSTPPTNQPVALAFPTFGNTSMTVSFDPATGSPAGYLVLRKAGSAPSFPSDNPMSATAYIAGNTIGGSTVAYSGSSTSFSDTGLSPGTTYFYAVFSYNGSSLTLNYYTTAPLQASKSTIANPPSAQPTGLSFSSIVDVSMTVGYTTASGSPAGYLVIRKPGSAPVFPADNPLPGIAYTAGNTIGGSTVAYSGSSVSFGDAGLAPATTYYYAVFSYTGSGVTLNYLTTSPLTGFKSTYSTLPIEQPSALTFTNHQPNSLTVTYSAAAGSPTGYLVLRKQGSAPVFPTDNPVAGSTYVVGNSVGGSIVAYFGNALTFPESGLSAATHYFYAVFAYNGNGVTTNYLIPSPLLGNTFTLATEPTAQPTNLIFNSIAKTTYTVAFTPATGTPAGYLVLRRIGASPTGVPSDATSYITGSNIGDGVVAFVGPGATFLESGLTAGTEYYYDVYSYNGSGPTLNYRTLSAPLENNTITVPPDPTAQEATADHPTGFTANWSTSAGAATYQLYVTTDPGFGSGFVAGYSPKSVSTNSDALTGLAIATTYYYRARAVNASGNSGVSATVSVTTQSPPPVADPATAITTTSFQANWQASPGASGYELDISSDNFNSFINGYSSKVISGLLENVTGLSPNTSYQYQVRALSTGVSGNSNSISVLTLPTAPTASASAITETSFTASWSSVSGITNYAMDLSTDNFATFLTGYNNAPMTGTSTTATGLIPGTTYQFRIRAVNATGPSNNSNVVSILLIPSAPTAASGTNATEVSFKANWSVSPGATDYFLDVSSDNSFGSILNGYSNLQITGTNSASVVGLTPGTIYYYRVRASNSKGTSSNSNAIGLITVPDKPVSQVFTVIDADSFGANWDAVQGADGYQLEVCIKGNNFVNLIPGYDPDVIVGGNNAGETVHGLSPSTDYAYRVRAFNTSGNSAYSNVKNAATTDFTGKIIDPPKVDLPLTQPSNQSVIGSVIDGSPPMTVTLSHRKILEANFTQESPISFVGTNLQIAIDASFLDALGMEFYFTVVDQYGRSADSPRGFVYTIMPSTAIPSISGASGGTREAYRIFSIPLALASNRIEDIFQPIIAQYGGIDKTLWRLVHYENHHNVDYGAGLTTIEPGKGYWFNSLESPQPVPVSGSVVHINQKNGFTLNLDAGFTQIGNPLPFNISWSDLLAQNATVVGISGVGSLYTYDAANVAFNKDEAILKAWEGGFVHSDIPVQLTIPVTIKQARIGGGDRNEIETKSIDQPEWFVPIKITQGTTYNNAIGLGMHPEAEQGYDRFDDFTIPRFVSYLEMNSYHAEYHTPKFSRDIVPTDTHHNWSFDVESNFDEHDAMMTWDNHSLGDNSAQLLLYDIGANIIVDMKKESSYRFEIREKHAFKIFFGADEKSLSPDISGLGRPFPNPFNQQSTIPFITGIESPDVQIAMYDMMGRKVREIVNGRFEPGYHEAVWDGSDEQGGRVSDGVYIYRLTSGTMPAQLGRIVLK